jgi:hypothetical protein
VEDTTSDAIRMQRMLMHLRSALPFQSAVTGRPLTIRALACWVYWCDQQLPPGARHGLVPPSDRDSRAESHRRAEAERYVTRKVLGRIDGHIGAVHRGATLQGARLRPERAYNPGSFRVGGLPGLYWGDRGTPIGTAPGEPSMEQVEGVLDAVEVVTVSLSDLETIRARLAAEPDRISVAERVAELLGKDGSAERILRRRLQRAREFEFVHLGNADARGITPSGKRLSQGALERHFRKGVA